MDQPVAAKPSAPAPWRTLDEVKAELMRRAGRLNPFEDIRREDAEQVVNALDSLDPGSIILRNGPTSTAAASRADEPGSGRV